MNIKNIKSIVDSDFSDEVKKSLIFNEIAKDKEAIPSILAILDEERNQSREILLDTNVELSRALIVLKDKNLKWNRRIIVDPRWVCARIIDHYIKWKHVISCNFNIKLNEDADTNGL